MTIPGDERMSDKEAISVLTEMREEVDFEFRVDRYDSALRIGAAAIEEREQLIDLVQSIFEGYGLEGKDRVEWEMYEGLGWLIKYGRVIRDGSGYRWKTKGDGK